MSIRFDAEIGLVKKLDQNLQISFGYHDLNPEKNKTGTILARGTKEDRAHIELKERTHPDSDKLCINTMNYTLCKGKIRITWNWTAEDNITAYDIDVFKKYHEEMTSSSMYEMTYDAFDKKFIIDVTYAPTYTNWEDPPMVWDIDSTRASIEWLTDDVEMLCMMRIADVTAWNIKQRDLLPGEETTVEKSGNECYIINTNDVLINNNKEASRVDGLKLVSDSAVYKNISSDPQKILKFYK